MKKIIYLIVFLVSSGNLFAQKSYKSYIIDFRKNYIKKHEVVTLRKDKKKFSFFSPDAAYKIEASFEAINDSTGFMMPTSGTKAKKFFRFGIVKFSLEGKSLQLTLYRSETPGEDSAYRDYIFLPFTDGTSGEESYGGGRYIDLDIKDIRNNSIIIDFNKAYNPYCAYAKGYNCPIPPRENDLPVTIKAGEMDFTGNH